jgi:glycosyltransferase involved in cell wall biosynthesis
MGAVDHFDVLHDKYGGHHIALAHPDAPFVTTEHGQNPPNAQQPCAISQDQADRWGKPYSPVLYNGIDPRFYRYSEVKDDYVLYLGSVQKIKGVVDWLKVVELAEVDGIVAGNSHEVHCKGYWEKECQPIVDRIRNVHRQSLTRIGEVSGSDKVNLFARARCLLFLPRVREAFGTVVIEALVSGTPVVTWDIGPMRELVEHGISGFVVPYGDHEAAARAVRDTVLIRPYDCFLQGCKFSDVEMAKAHLEVYERVAQGERWK